MSFARVTAAVTAATCCARTNDVSCAVDPRQADACSRGSKYACCGVHYLVSRETRPAPGGAKCSKPSYELMRRQGISRRSFLKFCSLTAASLGLGDAGAQQIAQAMETKPRTPVIWLQGLECTCCSESFIRSAHPLAKDVVLSMLSLDYDKTLMAAAGHQAEAALERDDREVQGQLHPRGRGQSAARRRRHLLHPRRQAVRREAAPRREGRKGDRRRGASCASWGCVQAAKPNPTQATPMHKVITDKPIIKVPGCPPIAEVMTGVRHLHPHVRPAARPRRAGPAEDVLQPARARQVLSAAALRRGPVRRAVRRRRRADGLLPVQGRLQGPGDLQRLLGARAGTRGCRSRSSRATAASAAPRTRSGTRARSTIT